MWIQVCYTNLLIWGKDIKKIKKYRKQLDQSLEFKEILPYLVFIVFIDIILLVLISNETILKIEGWFSIINSVVFVLPSVFGYVNSSTANKMSLQPYLNASTIKIKKNCVKIKIKKVGKGNLHNLELYGKSRESIMNIGTKIFNQFDINIF